MHRSSPTNRRVRSAHRDRPRPPHVLGAALCRRVLLPPSRYTRLSNAVPARSDMTTYRTSKRRTSR